MNPEDLPTIPVLDKGFVRLVDQMGNDLSIVRNARVSYNAAWRAGSDEEGDKRLIRYLMNNGHNTPFEAVEFAFNVKAPIFVFRQWHRHRTWSYNEVSARYKELPSEWYIPASEHIGTQSKDNKQMRNDDVHEYAAEISRIIDASNAQAYQTYKALIESGTPRELARSVLPVGIYSEMMAKVDLHNLFRFLAERLHPHAQYEIRVYAEAMLQLIRPHVPVAVDAWLSTQDLAMQIAYWE